MNQSSSSTLQNRNEHNGVIEQEEIFKKKKKGNAFAFFLLSLLNNSNTNPPKTQYPLYTTYPQHTVTMQHRTNSGTSQTDNKDATENNKAPVSQSMIHSLNYKSDEAWRRPAARHVTLQQYEIDVAFTALAKARVVTREAHRTQLLHAAIFIDTLCEQMSLFEKLPHKGDVHTFANDTTLDELTLQLEESHQRHNTVIRRTKRTVDQICEILDHYPEQGNTAEKTDEYLMEYQAVKRRRERKDCRQQTVVPMIPQARQQPAVQQTTESTYSTPPNSQGKDKENVTPEDTDKHNSESDQESSA